MRALALCHEPDGPPGLVGERLTERGVTVDSHIITHDYSRPNDATEFPSFADYDLIVPMGSVRSLTRTDEIDGWIDRELDLIRSAHEAGQPILGVCFGGQLLAAALGGSVEEAPTTEIGWFELSDGDVPNPVGPGPWMEWHFDRFIVPPGATVLARTDVADQLFSIGTTVGTQFHPEVDEAHLAGWLNTVDDAYLERNGTSRQHLIAETRKHADGNRSRCFALVDWFLDDVTDLGRQLPTARSIG